MVKRLLVLGASGMLGSTLLRYFARQGVFETHGTLRRADALPQSWHSEFGHHIHGDIDVKNLDRVASLVAEIRPDVVLNCVGLIKQLDTSKDPIEALRINALLPHELAKICTAADARLIHFSTDCVFSGLHGHYVESDSADADDLYGRSKRLGEVNYQGHLTLRTSIIGHELAGHHSLVDWFRYAAAAPGARLKGFRRAIFSGLPTIEMARVLHRHVFTDASLQGMYHLSAEPIDKCTLLQLVADSYGLCPELMEDNVFTIDRSLDSTAFRQITGYRPPSWPALVASMHDDFQKNLIVSRNVSAQMEEIK